MITYQSTNNEAVLIAHQSALDTELSKFPWHDSFVREAHALSPTYVAVDKRHVVAPDSPWTFRLLVCSADTQYPGLEFLFEEVDQIGLSGMVDLSPHGLVGPDGVILFLSAVDQVPIRAKRLRIRHLGIEAWGLSLRYGEENLFDEGGFNKKEAE